MHRVMLLCVLGIILGGSYVLLRSSQVIDPVQQQKPPDLGQLLKELKTGDDNTKVAALMALADFGPKAEPAIAELIALIQSKNEDLRLNAAILLGKIGKAAVPSVTKLLNAEDEDTRFYAISSLAWIGPDAQETAPLIVKALSDKSDSVRRKAANALGHVAPGEKSSIPILIGILGDANEDVRGAATEALGKFGPVAVPALIDAIKEKKAPKSVGAARALADIGSAAGDAIPVLKLWLYDGDGAWRHEAQEALGKIGKASIGVLVEALKDANEATRLAAISALGKIGADAVPDIVDAMGSKHVEVRRIAVYHLIPMNISDKMVVLAFAYGLKDEDQQVRMACVQGLQQLGPLAKLAAPKLHETLEDSNSELRHMAFYALQSMNENPGATLKKLMKDKDASKRIAVAALLMTTTGDKEAVQVLLEGLKEKNDDLRMQAALALAQRGQGAKELLPVFVEGLKSKNPASRQQAMQGLQMMGKGASQAAPILLDIMQNDPDGNMKQQAMHALQNVGGDPKVVMPVIKKMLSDENASVRLVAVQVVWRFGSEAFPLLMERLEDKDQSVRQQAVWGLQNVQADKESMPQIRQLLKHKDANVRLAAASLLIRSPDATEDDLVALLKDADNNVRWQAFHSMRSKKGQTKLLIPVLTEMIKDKKQTGRSQEFAIQALAQLGPEGWPALFDGLKGEIDPQVRANVTMQLGNYGEKSKEAMPLLLDGLKHNNVAVRHSAIQALQIMGLHAKEAVPALRVLLNDPDQGVRTAAQNALKAIEGK